MATRRHAAAVLGLALLLAAAGCLGPFTDGASTDDPSETDDGVAEGEATGDDETEGPGDGAGTADGRPVVATFADGDRRLAALTLVVADTPDERRRGLMDRSGIPEDGMVFVYPDEAPRRFWMKDTRIPLDMIFVADDGTVVHVAHASPPPEGRDDADLRRYGGVPARYVVEVERGTANATGIRPGTTVSFDPRPTVSSP